MIFRPIRFNLQASTDIRRGTGAGRPFWRDARPRRKSEVSKNTGGASGPRGEIMYAKRRSGIALAFAVLLSCTPLSLAASSGNDDSREVVVQWNQVLQDTIPAALGPMQFRIYAILNVAMFDAANSIKGAYTPYHVSVRASSGASTTAAVAQAAHDVLVGLFPTNQAVYDTALANSLAGLPSGRARQGVAVGRVVAARVLQWRANDGASAPATPYELPTIPGLWQPAAPGVPAGLTQLPGMTPFAIKSTTHFLPPRFPELTSARYAIDFEEVKALGSATSAARTAEQTQLARLFAGVTTTTGIPVAWNNIARDAAAHHSLSLIDTARVYALMTTSMMDGLMTSQTSKFVYGLWRPITAIRRADEDLNPATTADPSWTPLLGTPPYPSYAGNMACLGASAARALALGVGTNDVPFTVLWRGSAGNPDVPKAYSGFWQFAEDEADSRIYGGIHYRFDNEASQVACSEIAEYVHETKMRPMRP